MQKIRQKSIILLLLTLLSPLLLQASQNSLDTWSKIEISTTAINNTFSIGSNGTEVVVGGENGTVYAADNRSGSFTTQTISATNINKINSILHQNSISLLVSQNGRIFSKEGNETTWSEVSDTNTSEDLYSIIDANTTLVAVGANGTIIFSKDRGDSWSKTYSMLAANMSDTNSSWPIHAIYDVAFGADKIIAVGESGISVAFDRDTNQSTIINTPLTTDLYAIDTNGTAFIAVGEGGKAIYSTNGTTWTLRDTGVTADLYGVAFGYDSYLAVGANGMLVSSNADGTSWSQRYMDSSAHLRDVVYDGYGFLVSGDSHYIFVNTYVEALKNEPPFLSIDANVTTAYIPFDVNFTSTAGDYNGSISRYEWNFGDGGSSTDANTTHNYSFAGDYQVTLTVYDDMNLSTSKSLMINALALPKPTLSAWASKNSGSAPLIVDFNASASSIYGGVTYSWDFKDGSTSTTQNVRHTFDTNGTYIVEITATDASGKETTKQIPITVFAATNLAPSLSISSTIASPSGCSSSSGCPIPMSVDFSASATDSDGYIKSYYWDFGDGTTATTQNINHIYTTAGIYTVKSVVTDDDDYNTTRYMTVVASKKHEHMMNLYISKTSGTTPLDVNFTLNLQDPYSEILSYYWDFGDGNRIYNNSNTTHTYTMPTSHTSETISYIATFHIDFKAKASEEKNTTITLSKTANSSPTITSLACTQSSSTSLTVSCSTTATDSDGSIVSYAYNMGDGNTITTNQATFEYAYKDSGTYTIIATVTDDRGATASLMDLLYLYVQPIAIGSFTATLCTSSDCNKGGVSYTFSGELSAGANGIKNIAVNFGDGVREEYNESNKTSISMTHKYRTPGDYIATLIATDYNENTSFATKAITIEQDSLPIVATNMKDIHDYPPYSIDFESSSIDLDGSITTTLWNVNNEAIYSGTQLEHTLNEAGNYLITLKVIDDFGNTTEKNATIYLYNNETLSFYKNIEPSLTDGDGNGNTKYDKFLSVEIQVAKDDTGKEGDIYVGVQKASGFYYFSSAGHLSEALTPFDTALKNVTLGHHTIDIFDNQTIEPNSFSSGDTLYVGYKSSTASAPKFLKVLKLTTSDLSAPISEPRTLSMKSGWNLIATPVYVTLDSSISSTESAPDITTLPMSSIGDATEVGAIWRYSNGSWIKNPSTIAPGEGFWINAKKAYTATLEGMSYVPKSQNVQGWHLLGTGEKITDPNLYFNTDGIYVYRDGSWVLNPTQINIGEGFWLLYR